MGEGGKTHTAHHSTSLDVYAYIYIYTCDIHTDDMHESPSLITEGLRFGPKVKWPRVVIPPSRPEVI